MRYTFLRHIHLTVFSHVFLFFFAYAHSSHTPTIIFGDDLPKGVPRDLITSRFAATQLNGNATVSIGRTPQLLDGTCGISNDDVKKLGMDGFMWRRAKQSGGAAPMWCIVGDAGTALVNRGLLYGTYAALEQIGWAFLQPLQPLAPQKTVDASTLLSEQFVRETPRLKVRGFHYHTQHPLELHELLNGFDALNGTVPWQSMVPEFDLYAEWLVANGQNTLEWCLLWALDWDAFAWSSTRQQRLRTLTDRSHEWGLEIGADVAIADHQQHAWHMVMAESDAEGQIHRHVDWLADAHFDFISTENGYSEFTHGSCELMLKWMNILTTYAMDRHRMAVRIKVHCSTGQFCEKLKDPRNNKELNFNFLPMLANRTLGVMPHTVQFYDLVQPAPTYGNTNFTYMYEFLLYEMDKRETIFHPETAYWVQYDINVPLFLPLYARARVDDLVRLDQHASDMDGQVVFTSGWEWAYWLNDVVAARATWYADARTCTTLACVVDTIVPLLFVNSSDRAEFVSTIEAVAVLQRDTLVYGNASDVPRPANVEKRTGIGYITGWGPWNTLPALGALLGIKGAKNALTNAQRLDLQLAHLPVHPPPAYKEVSPLLRAMERDFDNLSQRIDALRARARLPSLVDELADSMRITALRASHVYALYDYATSTFIGNKQWRQKRWDSAVAAYCEAKQIIRRREAAYRVSVDRIGGWHQNPTAYHYGYLWTVKSMQYWVRDMVIARDSSLDDISPCLMNIMSPIDIAFGEGLYLNVTEFLYKVLEKYDWLHFIDECLREPEPEPNYESIFQCK